MKPNPTCQEKRDKAHWLFRLIFGHEKPCVWNTSRINDLDEPIERRCHKCGHFQYYNGESWVEGKHPERLLNRPVTVWKGLTTSVMGVGRTADKGNRPLQRHVFNLHEDLDQINEFRMTAYDELNQLEQDVANDADKMVLYSRINRVRELLAIFLLMLTATPIVTKTNEDEYRRAKPPIRAKENKEDPLF